MRIVLPKAWSLKLHLPAKRKAEHGQIALGAAELVSAPVSLLYRPPPPELGDRISSLYEMHQATDVYDEVERADRPQLRIMLSGGGRYDFSTGASDPAFLVTIIGPTSGTIHGVGFGPMHIIGAGLHPAAWVAFMGADSEKWADRAIDANQVFGDRAALLLDQIRAAPDTDTRFDILTRFVAEATEASRDAAPFAFIKIVDQWLIASPDPQVDHLLETTQLGVRQVERLTKRYYGLPPKTLARKYRALRAAAALARGEDLDDVGLSQHFYDQSHLIRELKRFAGLTPTQIKQRQSSLLTEISTGRKGLDGLVGKLVSDA